MIRQAWISSGPEVHGTMVSSSGRSASETAGSPAICQSVRTDDRNLPVCVFPISQPIDGIRIRLGQTKVGLVHRARQRLLVTLLGLQVIEWAMISVLSLRHAY